ncbi:MAG: DUF1211 domain-containing protein [Phycisphaerales bacterium]|nr:DUF1211 domain-containing protein [Phycisphaerales bacterium]
MRNRIVGDSHGVERWRGQSVSRIEALSDAVLGFAITLVIVSLEVPRTFDALLGVVRGFPVFAICFGLLALIWYKHYLFFRRYGLEDGITVLLNVILLFLVLFYVYPLKFLFSAALGEVRVTIDEGRQLFTIYGLGLSAVFVVIVLLYANALRQKRKLELSPLECHVARIAMLDACGYILVAGVSIGIARFAPAEHVLWAGWSYGLLGVTGFVVGYLGGVGRQRYESPRLTV